MAQDAWKDFELSGRVEDYLAYRQGRQEEEQVRPVGQEGRLERGMGSYGTEYSSGGNGIKCHADRGI